MQDVNETEKKIWLAATAASTSLRQHIRDNIAKAWTQVRDRGWPAERIDVVVLDDMRVRVVIRALPNATLDERAARRELYHDLHVFECAVTCSWVDSWPSGANGDRRLELLVFSRWLYGNGALAGVPDPADPIGSIGLMNRESL